MCSTYAARVRLNLSSVQYCGCEMLWELYTTVTNLNQGKEST